MKRRLPLVGRVSLVMLGFFLAFGFLVGQAFLARLANPQKISPVAARIELATIMVAALGILYLVLILVVQRSSLELEVAQVELGEAKEGLEEKVALQTADLAKFKLAAENISEQMIITNPEGIILYANPAVEKITGYTREEILGKRPSLWGKQMPQGFYEQMWDTIKVKKQLFAGELVNRRKNGELYSAKVKISPIIGEKGVVKFFVGLEQDESEIKEFEKKLKEERDQYQAIVNTMGEGLIVIDDRHNIALINRAAGDLLGVEPLEVIGKRWSETVVAYTADGREIPADDRTYSKVLNDKKQVVTELPDGHYYRSGSGKLFPIISVTTYLSGVGVVKVFRDMTEEAAVKEAIKKERDLAQAIVKSMGEGLLVIDDKFRLTMINPAAELMLGIRSDKLVGQKWSNLIKAYAGSKPIPFAERAFNKVLKTGKEVVTQLDADHYYVNRSGGKFPLISVTTPLTDHGTVGAVKVFRDATAEKEAKNVLQAQSSVVLENAGEAIVLTDEKGKLLYINPAFERMVETKNSEMAGKVYGDAFKFFDLNDKPLSAAEIADAAAVTAKHQEEKLIIETKTGRKVALVVNAAPIKVGQEFKGVVRVIHDYSEELALQKQKDDFFSIASHELRTPLTVIVGNLDTVLAGYGKSQITEEDKQLLKDTETAGDRLILLVNNFLNVSRLDQGRVRMTLKEQDVCQVTEEVVKEMKTLTDEKGLKLTYSCSADRPKVLADEALMKEVLINLIGNSVKFTEKGGIEITQAIRGGNLVTRLADTGIGIAKDKQKMLFQRFQQVMERTISREAGGTGLGLYISREFARLMGGDLVLAGSGLGEGTVFELILPIVNQGLAGGEKQAV